MDAFEGVHAVLLDVFSGESVDAGCFFWYLYAGVDEPAFAFEFLVVAAVVDDAGGKDMVFLLIYAGSLGVEGNVSLVVPCALSHNG